MKISLHRRLITVVALALIVAGLAACYPPTGLPRGDISIGSTATSTETSPVQMNTIEGDWQLVSVGGTPAVAGAEATMLLAGGRATGTTGCNRYNGSYELNGADGIKFGVLAMTLMACPPDIMAQEQVFTNVLSAATNYALSEDSLVLKDASGSALAMLKPRRSTALTGTNWAATGINNGQQAVVSLVVGTEVTAVFDADGTLSGKAGCNQYSAAYTVDGNKMTIEAPITTRMFCGEPAGVMEQEQAYLTALTNVTTFSIDGDRLGLRAADGALQATFVAQ